MSITELHVVVTQAREIVRYDWTADEYNRVGACSISSDHNVAGRILTSFESCSDAPRASHQRKSCGPAFSKGHLSSCPSRQVDPYGSARVKEPPTSCVPTAATHIQKHTYIQSTT